MLTDDALRNGDDSSGGLRQVQGHFSDGYGVGHVDKGYRWWQYVDTPYQDWDNEEILVALWKKHDFARYYAPRLKKLCDIAATVLGSNGTATRNH